MLNYIKSELYRVWHVKIILSTAGIFSVIVFVMNFALFLFKDMEHFRYGITSFSFSMIVSMPMIYCYVAADIAATLYEGDRKNGMRQNSVANGISRMEIFAGKCIVSLITALAILAIILPVYIFSAVLLLKPAGPVTVGDMLMELPAAAPAGIASVILAVLLLEAFDKAILSILAWIGIMVVMPKVFLVFGMIFGTRGDVLTSIAMWMPQNFFSAGMQVNMSECVAIWDTPAGMGRCILAGAAGIVIFSAGAVLMLRKKEI